MNQRSSVSARALAATALVCGFLVVIVIVAASLGDGGDGGSSGGGGNGGQATTRSSSGGSGERRTPKTYVVQSGDTLTSIAHKTGVTVARIVALNPGVDPQILVAGEKLKLR